MAFSRTAQAESLLYEHGLAGLLGRYGAVHLIGSYRMGLMAWDDLDLYVENERMSLDCVYELVAAIMPRFRPSWLEAKEELIDGKMRQFVGFETSLTGELWNLDIWFYTREDILAAEAYCDGIAAQARQDPALGEAIVAIKGELIARELYGFGHPYQSVDVYAATTKDGVRTLDEFLAWGAKRPGSGEG